MLRQYFFGISFSIAPTFRRAGLKMLSIISAPGLLERVARRRLRARGAGAFSQRLAVPMNRQFRRQDRPAHVGEAIDEEARGAANDVVFGLEEGDEAPVLAVNLAEANEGVHLVNVAAHAFASSVSRRTSGSASSSSALRSPFIRSSIA